MTIALSRQDVLYDYLGGIALGLDEVATIMDQATLVLDTTAMMAADFAELHPGWLLLDAYYRGSPPLPTDPKRLTRKYRELHEMSRSNWCGLVVDVVNERLKIGSIKSTANATQDKTAWQWWQANNMDGQSPQIHNAALRYGLCYVSVWPGKDKNPRIIGKPPVTSYVRTDYDTGEPLVAIDIWEDRNCGCVHADLTMPDYQYHLTCRDQLAIDMMHVDPMFSKIVTLDVSDLRWEFRVDEGVVPVERNPMGCVPYVPVYTNPDLTGGFSSELTGLTPVQDRINKTNFDRLMAQSFASFPRAWITGIDVPEGPDGKPREPVDAAVDRLWTFTDPATKVGQLDAAELAGYINAVTADVQALATQSRTPPHYLVAGMGQFPSGESVRATEYGLTRKVEARQQSYGDAWSNVLRLCGQAVGNKRLANDLGLNVVWKDVEARTEGEVVDALLKMGTLGVPWPSLWQRWGASPEEIAEWTKKLEANAQVAAALAGSSATPTPRDMGNAATAISGAVDLAEAR